MSSRNGTAFIPGWSWAANGLLVLATLIRLAGGPQQTSQAVYMPAVAAAAIWGGVGPGFAMAFATALTDVLLSIFWPAPAASVRQPWMLLVSGLVLSGMGGAVQRLLGLRAAEALVANGLLRFGRSVGDPTQLPVLQRAVVDSGPPLIQCDYGALFIWDEELRRFELATQSTGAEQRGFQYFPAASAARWQGTLADSGPQPMDAAGLDALPIRDAHGRPLLRRALWVPMRRWGRRVGGLLFGSTAGAAAFTPWETRIAEGMAGQIAVAMESAEAFETLHARADEIRTLLQLTQDLNSHLELSQLRRRIAEHAAALGRARVATVGLWEEDGLWFDGWWTGREWRAASRREPDADARLPVAAGVTTGLGLVIRGSDGERLGVVEVYARLGDAPFTPEDLRLLSALLNVAAVSIQNARLYERLRHQNVQLRELEKLRDDLTDMVVHDLRTPLSGILTALQTMEAGIGGALPPEAAAVNRIALDNATELLAIVNDLLDISKLESGQMRLEREAVTPSSLVERAMRQVERLCAEKRLSLEVGLTPDLPAVDADVSSATRILVNLLGNAVKFTPTGGRIRVAVSQDPHSGQVVFQVRDTGPGIPREFHERVFEKFAQVEGALAPSASLNGRPTPRPFSTGLGLTYCKRATEAHGGRIGVESEPGCGSMFTFTLPASPEPLPPPLRDEGREAPVSENPLPS